VLPDLSRGGILKGAMETRTKPGAMAGYDRLIRVKMTRSAGDLTGSGNITVQIFIFRGNPLKYTDPDGTDIGFPATVTNNSDNEVNVHMEDPPEPGASQNELLSPSESARYYPKGIDGVGTRSTEKAPGGKVYKGKGSVTIDQDEEGEFQYDVSFGGKIINGIGNILKFFGNLIKRIQKKNPDLYYGVYNSGEHPIPDELKDWIPETQSLSNSDSLKEEE
jgi:hypothetical protein